MTSPVATVSSVKRHILQIYKGASCQRSGVFLFTFRFFNGMADTKPVAHMVKGLVARVAPLIYVVTRAGPDQVVERIIARPCSREG